MSRSIIFGLILAAITFLQVRGTPAVKCQRYPSRENFCEMYAECHEKARQNFEKCAGGNVVSMILAKNGVQSGPNASSTTTVTPTFLAKNDKCVQKLNDAVGARMRELYDNVNRQTRSCAAQLANSTTFQLDEAATLLCHAISTEIVELSAAEIAQLRLAISDEETASKPNTEKYGAESDSECALVHSTELRRCKLAASCCPQYASCRRQANAGSGTRIREMIVGRSFDECVQKSTSEDKLRAAANESDIDYAELRARIGAASIADVPNVRDMIAAVMADETGSGLSLRDVHPRIRVGVYERLMKLRSLRKQSDLRYHPSNTTTTTTTTTELPNLPTLPPPDKALRQLVDLLFPGLRTTTVLPTTIIEISSPTSSTTGQISSSSTAAYTATVAAEANKTITTAKLTVNIKNAAKTTNSDSDNKSALSDDVDAAATLNAEARKELREQAEREKTKENAKERKANEDILANKDEEKGKNADKENDADPKTATPSESKEKNIQKDKKEKGQEKEKITWSESESEEMKEKGKKHKSDAGKESTADEKKKSKQDDTPPSPWSIHGSVLSQTSDDAVVDAESAENETIAADASAADTSAEHVFCVQYFECRKVLHDQYNSCEDQHLEGDKKNGISDRLLRGIFEANVGVDDTQIQRRCFEAIDAGSQSQLVALRNKIKHEIRDCTHNSQKTTTASQLTAKKVRSCESIQLLSALSSAMKLDHDAEAAADHGKTGLRRCNERLAHLERKCNELHDCCPTHIRCERLSGSENAQKYAEIVDQLKQEQNLCERRYLRLRNGLM